MFIPTGRRAAAPTSQQEGRNGESEEKAGGIHQRRAMIKATKGSERKRKRRGGIIGRRGTRRGKVTMEAATGGDRETLTLSRGLQDS